MVTAKATFVCNFEGCLDKQFGRKAELRRHQRDKHGPVPPRFPCTAVGCNRVGPRAFHRTDKLYDHVLKGHDASTLFKCPRAACTKLLTRDLMSLHPGGEKLIHNRIRKCPLPKCSFLVSYFGRHSQMDDMRVHLQEKHDVKGRMNYANLLSERGYDARTAAIFCPICPPQSAHFLEHASFRLHFLTAHCRLANDIDPKGISYGVWAFKWEWECPSIRSRVFGGEGVRQHRNVLLSLMPFIAAIDIWEDIEHCEG